MKTKRQSRRTEPPDISTALEVARWFWPEFKRVGDGTFLGPTLFPGSKQLTPEDLEKGMRGGREMLDEEAFYNHTHVFDLFAHRAYSLRGPPFDRGHPDFAAACRLGVILCEVWAAKLRRDFPNEDYAVICTRDDNPIVRFHKVREDRALWLDLDRCTLGTVLLIHSRDGRRVGNIMASPDPKGSRRRPNRRPPRVGA